MTSGPLHPRLVRRARATRPFLAALVLVGVLTAALVIVQAWLLAHAVVGVVEHRALDPVAWMLLALVAVFAARGLLSWASSVAAHRAAAEVKSQLRREVLAARLRRPGDHSVSSSSVLTVVTTGLDALDGYYAKYLPQLALALAVPTLVGAVLLVADWRSALIVLLTLPLIPVFMALVGWTTQKATARRFAVLDRLANHFGDLVEGLPTLQAFGRARAQARGVELTEESNRRETMRTLSVSFLSSLVLELVATLSVAVVAVTVGFRLVFGQVDFTTALFVLVLAPEAYLPVRMVGTHFHDSADGVAAADAAFAIIDAAGPTPGPGVEAPSVRLHPVRFEQVTLTHPGATTPALADFSLTLHPGEVVALTGPSGSGKTTAVNLLLGFVVPDRGQVAIGDHPLPGRHDLGSAPPVGATVTPVVPGGATVTPVDLAGWRRQLAFVGQTPGMVAGTIADNVRLGVAEASDQDVAQALADVGAPFDLSRPVGEEAEGLSAGERRRVALARALVRIRVAGAGLLVLDEPTAGLDAETEETVLAAVRASGAGALVVSHRPAVLNAADRVVTLEPSPLPASAP